MADEFCLKMPDFDVTFRDLLHAVNLRHGTDSFTSPPKEGVLSIFLPWEIQRLRSGLNPRTCRVVLMWRWICSLGMDTLLAAKSLVWPVAVFRPYTLMAGYSLILMCIVSYRVSQKSLDSGGRMLNIECQGTSAPPCIVQRALKRKKKKLVCIWKKVPICS